MKQFYIREDNEALKEIRSLLQAGEPVEIHNTYDTFYGVDFDNWLKEGISDIACEIQVTSWNKWERYPWTYIITPNK